MSKTPADALEYPKHVYLEADVTKESRIVRNLEEEAKAAEDDYREIPRHFGPGISGVADAVSVAALDYPRFLYAGGDVEAESLLVKNSDEEAAAVADGFARLAQPVDDLEHRTRRRRR